MDHHDLSSIRKDKLARKGEDTIGARHSAVQMRDEAQGRVTFMITTCRNAYTVAVRQGFVERGTIIGWFVTYVLLPATNLEIDRASSRSSSSSSSCSTYLELGC